MEDLMEEVCLMTPLMKCPGGLSKVERSDEERRKKRKRGKGGGIYAFSAGGQTGQDQGRVLFWEAF
jgi:hypothetical protein